MTFGLGGEVKVRGGDVAIVGTPPFVDDGDLQAQIPGLGGTIVPDPSIIGPVLQGIFGGAGSVATGAAKSILGIPSIDPKELQKLAIGFALYFLLFIGVFALIWPQGPGMALVDKALDAIPGDEPPAPAPEPKSEPASSTPATKDSGELDPGPPPKKAPAKSGGAKGDKAAKAAKVAKVAKVLA